MKNTFRLIAFALILYFIAKQKLAQDATQNTPPAHAAPASQNTSPAANGASASSADDGSAELAQDFQQHRDKVRVQGSGTVVKLLREDDEGLKHQKFLLRTRTGQTVLVAHDIDIAPRVDDLKEGDTVEFNGEYVWTEQGGVVHWTHHDPEGRHPGGWLKHDGHTYQ